MILDLRWLGFLSIVAIVITAALPLLGKPLDWQDSVSHSWAGSRRTWRLIALVLTLAGTGLCVSLALWAVPHYHLPGFMYGIIALAYVALIAVAWIPMTDKPGDHSFTHGHFLGGSILVTLAIIAMATVIWCSTNVPGITRIVCLITLLVAASWPLLFLSPARRIFLILESLIAVLFSLAIALLFIA